MHLVDTNALSAAAPTKAVPRQDVRDWMDRNSEGVYLSVITVAEIQQGIMHCLRTGAYAKAERLAGCCYLDVVQPTRLRIGDPYPL